MGVIEVFYDRFDGLTVAETIDYNGKKKVKRIHGDMAKLYFNVLSNQRIKGRRFADNCEFVLYADKCIKIYDYKFIREYQLLDEYLSEVDRQVKENKERLAQRVKRKNKYKNAKVLAFGLAILILGSSVLMAVSSKATNNTGGGGNSGYSQTTATPNYDITINIGKPTGGSGSQLYGPEDSFDVSDGIKDDHEVGDVEQDDVEYIFIDYYDRSVNDKAQKTRELYGSIIEKYANMYGLDPSLVLALATQERGVHSSVMDRGGATGLMQIQNSIWVGKSVTAYNFEKGCKETCNITKDNIGDCETNIKLGCMILQDFMRQNNYNILLALQAYNMGTRGVSKAVVAYANSIGCSKEEVVNNPDWCGWMDYRCGITGDDNYVEHVLSYIGTEVKICVYKPDGTKVECCVRNFEYQKTR